MLLIDNHNTSDPAINLALEEHCYRNLDALQDYILFYINEPSIIFGNHQNPFQEYDPNFAVLQRIQPVRRISGGGTVYHDSGNLNFSYITAFKGDILEDFKTLLQPILNALKSLGVPAMLAGKNNINVGGKKISGNSQHTNMHRLLSHGTLLFNSDLSILNRVLISNLKMIKTKGVQSIKSQVTNITNYLSHSMDMDAFLVELKSALSKVFGDLKKYQLTADEWNSVYRLAEEKYRSWDWTFGRSPDFMVRHKYKIETKDVEVHVSVKRGIIKEIKTPKDNLVGAAIRKDLNNFIGERYGSESMNQMLE